MRGDPLKPGCVFALVWLLGCAGTPSPSAAPAKARATPPAPAPAFVSPYSYEWFVRAELLAARGEYAGAVEAYRTAMSASDADPYLHARLAEALARTGDFAGAGRNLEQALQLDARSEAVWMAYGAVAELRGEPAAALAAYERAEVAAPESPKAPRALARLLYAGGQDARALAVLVRYGARSRHGLRPALRARLQQAIDRHDVGELSAVARQWLRYAPREHAVFQRAAHELQRQGDPAAALALLQQLPSSRRGELEASLLLALGRFDALEQRLLEEPPESFGGPLGVAELLLDAGRAARALDILSEAPPEQAPHRYAWLHGRALLALERPSEAGLWLAKVPAGSRYRAPALLALRRALEAGGLPELAAEVEAEAPR